MIKTYHCVFRMALRQQFIGFSDAIAPVKSEELIWLKQPETYWMLFSCRNCFVLFIIVCLCIFSLKLQNMRFFSTEHMATKARNRKAIWFCNAACSQLVRKRWRGSVGVMAAKHLRSAVINMDITN